VGEELAWARVLDGHQHAGRPPTGNYRGGCWDIFAWRDSDNLFVESKQRSNDSIRSAQAVWLEQTLENGVSLSCFLIAEYVIDHGPA
jgi:hypothetical protein